MAWMLHYILLFIAFLNVPTQALATLLLPEYWRRGLLTAMLFLAFGGILAAVNRRGHTVMAGRLFNIVTWMYLTLAAFTAGGVDSPAIAGQFLIVSTAGALLGWRWGAGAVALCIATVAGLGIAEFVGVLPPAFVEHTPLTRLTFLVFYLLTLGFEWMLILVTLRRSKERTEREIIERRAAESAVRELNADLERRVAERTRALESAVSELEEINLRLDEATQAKSQLVANVSHELRTPLNSIIGFSTLLRQQLSGPLNEEQKRQLGMIRDAGQRLLELVSQILDLSSIEAGEAAIASEEFDIVDLVKRVATIFEPLAAEKDLSVTLKGSPAELIVRGDRARTEQVLLNLVGNAIKFTERGGVTVGITDESDHVEIRVRDTGLGVEEGDRETIFERFYQAVPPAGGKYEGSGLGLPVAREIARLVGGDIVLDRTDEGGSTFVFRLPR